MCQLDYDGEGLIKYGGLGGLARSRDGGIQ